MRAPRSVPSRPTATAAVGTSNRGSFRHAQNAAADVRVGKYLEVKVEGEDRSQAEALVNEMCEKLLANPVIEEYRFDLERL